MAAWLACVGAGAQSLLENGSFEVSRNLNPKNTASIAQNTQIDSWTVGGGNGIMYVDGVMMAAEGARFVQLQFVTANYIQQSLATVPSQKYRVYFEASAYVGPNGAGARLMRGKATARSTGDAIIATKDFSYDGTGKSFPNVGWAAFTLDFTADASVTTIRFESSESGNNGGPCVDNVRVVPGHDDGQGAWVISGPPVFVRGLSATTPAVVGRSLSLQAEALGDAPLGYQWYRVNNTTFTPIADATNATYEIASFASNQSGTYALIVTNHLAAITNRTSVLRISPPSIAGQPEEQHLAVGGNLNFGPSSFSGSAPDRFQWYKDGAAVEGQTNQFFTKSNVQLSDAGSYSVWVANIAGETNSVTVPVFIFSGGVPPWIKFNQFPAERAIQEGGSLFLTLGGQGTQPLTYFWYKDGQVLASTSQNNYSKNGLVASDAGLYWGVISNAFGTVTSSNMNVIVYPPQESPQFKSTFVNTNVAEGVALTLVPELVRGSHLKFQWYKRPLNDGGQPGEPIPGANSLELPLGVITYDAAANYTLIATNYVGQNQMTFSLNVVAKPIFSSPLQGFEGPEGSFVQLTVSIQNFSPGLTYQWFKDGQPISGATQSSYRFTASSATAGSYTVVVKNEAGESTSTPASVAIRAITPADKQFRLVADYTLDAPERNGVKLTVVGDGNLRNNIVTFQSTTNFNDIGGLYRWENGTVSKIVDLNDSLPGLSAPPTWYDGVSAEENGLVYFVAVSTNAVGNQMGIFESQNGIEKAIVTQESDIPGKPGLRVKRFGYTTRAGGKTAFFAMENDTGAGGYRCVLVWDGVSLSNWANSDNPLPAGDGLWWGNSSQVGFDGARLAFWAVDNSGANGGNNGIFTCVNGGPLQKIAFTGDAIPGGGTFKGFNSPPRVHDGKVLFLGQGQTGANMLLEFANGVLRIVARTGDAPSGGGAFSSLSYNFDYLADGSILFSANGPGQKQGIYNWKDGVIRESLTTLNSINGRVLRYVSLYDADGMDCLITASFDGSRFGLYTTASGQASAAPTLSVSRKPAAMTLNWSGPGSLQESTDLRNWIDLNVKPPFDALFNAAAGKYFRVVER